MKREQEIQELKDQIGELSKRLRGLSSDMWEEGEEKVGEAKKRIQAFGDDMKDNMDDASRQVRQKAKQADDFVKEHPWGAMVTGLAIGLLLGKVMGRNE